MEDKNNISFARKYRPAILQENPQREDVMPYIGNKNAVNAIMNSLRGKRRPQTILLSGHPSCGKTSLGRLTIQEYLCENWSPETGACCQCSNCKEIEQYIRYGKTEDLLIDSLITEVNVAVDRGIKNIESLIEEAQYVSMSGEPKAWILDEFHRASPEAQSAMLKIIEEPPENTLWIFCTTAPEAIDTALRTRFDLDLELSKPSMEDMLKMLKIIAKLEGFKYEERAFRMLIGRDDFVPRDIIHDIELILTTHDSVTYDATLEVLQEVRDDLMFNFLDALLTKDVFEYIRVLHETKQKISIDKFVTSLATFINRGIYIMNGVDVDGLTGDEMKSYKKLFNRFTGEQLVSLMTKVLDMRGNVSAETQLLLMGYSGLESSSNISSEQATKDDVSYIKGNLQLVDIAEEVSMERSASLKSVQDKNAVPQEQIDNNISELTDDAGIDDILALFSSSDVKR